MAGAPVEILQHVPIFAGLDRHEVEQIALLFKERRFAKGETVVREGSGGAAFFLIDSGEATVSVGSAPRYNAGAGGLLRRDCADRRGDAFGDDHRRD